MHVSGTLHRALFWCGLTALTVTTASANAAIRIVSYNIDADTDRNGIGPTGGVADAADAVYPAAAVAANIVSMGNYALAGRQAPVDVIALQELYTTPSTTLSAIINNLNATYGANTYAYDSFVGYNGGNLPGNGPNGLIYNTKTVRVLSAVGIASTSGSGAPRTPVRYQLQAFTESGSNTFYLYNDHAKAGSAATASGSSNNETRRAYEYDVVRTNADALGAAAHVIFAGDANFDNAQNEKGYRDLTAAPGTTLSTNGNPTSSSPALVGGVAQAFDPLGNSFSGYTNGNSRFYTETNDDLFVRDDFQLITGNVRAGDASGGLQLVPQTYTAFGNSFYTGGGLTSVNATFGTIVNSANAAALGLSLSQLQSLAAATDHLPVLADYVIAPEPTMVGLIGFGFAVMARKTRREITALPS